MNGRDEDWCWNRTAEETRRGFFFSSSSFAAYARRDALARVVDSVKPLAQRESTEPFIRLVAQNGKRKKRWIGS